MYNSISSEIYLKNEDEKIDIFSHTKLKIINFKEKIESFLRSMEKEFR